MLGAAGDDNAAEKFSCQGFFPPTSIAQKKKDSILLSSSFLLLTAWGKYISADLKIFWFYAPAIIDFFRGIGGKVGSAGIWWKFEKEGREGGMVS